MPVNPMIETQELARRFNMRTKRCGVHGNGRALRQLLGSGTSLSEDTLNYLDWQAAGEYRAVSAVGVLPSVR